MKQIITVCPRCGKPFRDVGKEWELAKQADEICEFVVQYLQDCGDSEKEIEGFRRFFNKNWGRSE